MPFTNPLIRSLYHKIGKQTLVMGILNITPDSFSDGGQFLDLQTAVGRAVKMVDDGADMIDIGGESTRPGSEPVPADEEIRRVVPVIHEITSKVNVPISIDTYKAEVAAAALDAGASIINDISAATFDHEMPRVIAERGCPAILMHIKGEPKSMQANPHYDDVVVEVRDFLESRINALTAAGVSVEQLMVDPGIGFGKTVEHNLELLRHLAELKTLGRPIVIGTSRKATIGKVLGGLPPEDRLEGTAATVAISIANGADVVRVHDVKEMARVAKMTDAIVRGYHG